MDEEPGTKSGKDVGFLRSLFFPDHTPSRVTAWVVFTISAMGQLSRSSGDPIELAIGVLIGSSIAGFLFGGVVYLVSKGLAKTKDGR